MQLTPSQRAAYLPLAAAYQRRVEGIRSRKRETVERLMQVGRGARRRAGRKRPIPRSTAERGRAPLTACQYGWRGQECRQHLENAGSF